MIKQFDSFLDFLKIFKKMWGHFCAIDHKSQFKIISAVVFSAVIGSLLPQLTRYVFNSLENNKMSSVTILFFVLIALFVFKIANKILEFLRELVAFKIEILGMRSYFQQLLLAYLKVDSKMTQKWKRGETVQRLSSDPVASEGSYIEPVVELGYTICLVVITIVMGLQLDSLLLSITFVLLAIIFPGLCFFAYQQRYSAIQERTALSGYSNFVSDMVEGLKEIQQTRATKEQIERGFESIENILKSEQLLFFRLGSLKPAIRIAYVFVEGIIFAVGIYRITNGNLRLGDLLGFIGYLELLSSPILYFAVKISTVQKSIAAVQRIEDTLEVLDQKDNQTHLQSKNDLSERSAIHIQNLGFSYAESSEKNLLSVSELDIKQGDMVAVVGPNGQGKTTLLNLITGHYLANEGTINIYNQNMTHVRCLDRPNKIGYVMQDPYLFSGTILDNFMTSATSEVLSNLEILGLLPLLERLPNGLNTYVGKYQRPLSKGEIRAVAMGRCLANAENILILDEPTTGLAHDVKKKFVENLRNVSEGKTIVCSTHDQDLIDQCNRVIEINQGQIHEKFLNG